MISKRRMSVLDLKAGMVLANSVFSQMGNLLISEHCVLNNKMIMLLRINTIYTVYIEIEHPDIEPEIQEELAKSPTAIKNTAEFKQFEVTYNETLDVYTNSLNQIIYQKENINTDKLLKEVGNLIHQDTNHFQLFSMLHNLRGSDDVTYVHSVNVALISNIIGKWMNLSKEEMEILTVSGLLHDIGKTQISSEIINKPGPLTPSEKNEIRKHPILGYNIIKNQTTDQRIKNVVLMHHERCDGSGYPLKSKGGEISHAARIIAVADVYDAMTSNRCYRKAINPFDVIHMFEVDGYMKFDTGVVLAFLNNILETYIHSQVLLNNGQVGEIVFLNKKEPSKPILRIGGKCVDLLLTPTLSIVNIV